MHEGAPIDAANDFIEGLSLGDFWSGAEEATSGVVDKADISGGFEEEDAFLESFEDFLQESLFPDETGEEGLNLSGFDLIESGDDFFEDGRFHDGDRMSHCLMFSATKMGTLLPWVMFSVRCIFMMRL